MRYRHLVEKYTADNSYLLRYLKDGKFDPYTYWNEIGVWLGQHEEYLELLSELTGREFHDADEVNEEEPDIFYKLPEDVQHEAAEWVIDWLMRHDPAEAPTTAHAGLSRQQLLPATTWLVHFTDDPDGIAQKGFIYGVHDVSKLGLTTYMSKDNFYKRGGGYNFAFRANTRYANWAASEHKYGRDAVLFQNSGVVTQHYADEEEQIIFNGKDVDPRSIVILRNEDGDWQVAARRRTRGDRPLYSGTFENAVLWVQQHYDQYRRYLTGY